jgi:hypothetical protein
VLEEISRLHLGSWNYKDQDPETFRHYGPMAQEFFAAFGNDGIGTIGNDTLLNAADVDGILFIAIQELTNRTEELSKKINELEEAHDIIRELYRENSILRSELAGRAELHSDSR